MSVPASKYITLRSSDGKLFNIPPEIMVLSNVIRMLLQTEKYRQLQSESEEPIPLTMHKVSSVALEKIVAYCLFHHKDPEPTEVENEARKSVDDIGSWDLEFMKVDQKTLFLILNAAEYMQIPGLVDLCCKTVAKQLTGKSAQQIRDEFRIKNDITERELAQIHRENYWNEDD